MLLRSALAALIWGLAVASRSLFRLPSNVGNGEGAKHPCVAVMRETQDACRDSAYGEASGDCHFALCLSAGLNRERCADVVTDGSPVDVLFPDDLDKLMAHHAVTCSDGGQGGTGRRNALFDCAQVNPDGLWDGQVSLAQFAARHPVSAAVSGLERCLQ
mmetsp:Transcript_66293/g.153961  ORF Transcript_66293/g.153961 Transcript_66293/m.153961 type:complete len:159 (-) Transcript_66293:140-616(-)